jgi:cytochrome c551/c552
MSRSRITAFVGTIAAAAACTVFATSAASAAPAPSVSSHTACGSCWGPGPRNVTTSAPQVAHVIAASVGSAAAGLRF